MGLEQGVMTRKPHYSSPQKHEIQQSCITFEIVNSILLQVILDQREKEETGQQRKLQEKFRTRCQKGDQIKDCAGNGTRVLDWGNENYFRNFGNEI